MLTAIVIFAVTYFFIIMEKIPNSVSAMLGAFFIVLFRILSQEQAIHYVDFSTIGLLTGMMMIVAIMKKTGIFEYIAIKSLKSTRGDPTKMLISMAWITAVLSAILDNVTTVLILAPITFAIADTVKMNPMPLLITQILFSNIGGAATLIGDPPNIMIGGATHLTFMDFIVNNTPIVILVSFVTLALLKIIYKKELVPLEGAEQKISYFDENKAINNKNFLIKTLVIFAIVIFGFTTHSIHGIEVATLALWGGFTMLLFTGIEPDEILKEVEWSTLFFFIGLFIIVGGLEQTNAVYYFSQQLISLTGGAITGLSLSILWLSALATTIINSIPYTATMIKVIHSIATESGMDVEPLWWALSLGACFGGNGTIIGASANLIVAGFARKNNVIISFKDYFKIGFPLMILSVVMSTVYIYVRYLI